MRRKEMLNVGEIIKPVLGLQDGRRMLQRIQFLDAFDPKYPKRSDRIMGTTATYFDPIEISRPLRSLDEKGSD
jgi:hypothetical protein